MGIQAVFETKLTVEDVESRAGRSLIVRPRGDGRHVMLYPQNEEFKVQILAGGIVNVWCRDLDHLEEVKRLLNEQLSDSLDPEPFKKPKEVRHLGSIRVPPLVLEGAVRVGGEPNYEITRPQGESEEKDKFWTVVYPPGSCYYHPVLFFKSRIPLGSPNTFQSKTH